jgi:LDH2 family malate/lactate/ureidoglycolate dehydrogenase
MPGVENGVLFPAAELRKWTEKIFQKVDVSREDSQLLTDSLIEANLRGVDTHGITRMLTVYVNRIRAGVLNPKTKLDIVREKPSTALVDCNNSIGQVASQFAMDLAIQKAKSTGTAFVATTHSNHYGAAAYWSMKALDHGMIGFSSTNGPASFAPTGGRTPMLGTNPFSIAIPAGKELPFVLDLATTVVARGRISLYAKQDKALEPGWAFDAAGRPTTDPHEALKGLLAPIGGYKGYGIALAIDMLSGVLTGSKYGTHFPGFLADNLKDPTDVGSIFAAVSIDSFMDLPEFTASMDTAIREIRNCARVEGVDRIYIPGEIEIGIKEERLADGIPLPEPVLKDFVTLGTEMGVPFPEY